MQDIKSGEPYFWRGLFLDNDFDNQRPTLACETRCAVFTEYSQVCSFRLTVLWLREYFLFGQLFCCMILCVGTAPLKKVIVTWKLGVHSGILWLSYSLKLLFHLFYFAPSISTCFSWAEIEAGRWMVCIRRQEVEIWPLSTTWSSAGKLAFPWLFLFQCLWFAQHPLRSVYP